MPAPIQAKYDDPPCDAAAAVSGSPQPHSNSLSRVVAMFLASSAGGAASAAISQPCVVLKTRLQAGPLGKVPWPTCAELMHGLPLGVASSMQKTVLNYTLQDAFSRQLEAAYPEQRALVAFASGGIAGALDAVVTAAPRRVMVLQMLPEHRAHARTAWDAARYVYANDGMRGFFTAAGTVTARNSLAAAVFFGVVHGLRESHGAARKKVAEQQVHADVTLQAAQSLYAQDGMRAFLSPSGFAQGGAAVQAGLRLGVLKGIRALGDEKSSLVAFLIGAAANVASVVVSNPLDVVKTAMQKDVGQKPGAMAVAQRLYAAEGSRAFFKGVVPNILRLVPAGAAAYVVTHAVLDAIAPGATRSP